MAVFVRSCFAALQNFLIDAFAKQSAQKRGGDLQFVSWDDWMAEAPSRLSIPAAVIEKWPAERIFDVRWAATLAERALRRLGEECESHGRRRVFDALSGCLTAEREDVSYETLAEGSGSKRLRLNDYCIRCACATASCCGRKWQKQSRTRPIPMTSCGISVPRSRPEKRVNLWFAAYKS